MRIGSGILKHWLPIAAISVILCGLVYLAVQQALRGGLNDPQIQMAEDAASAAASGTAIESILPPGRVDIARSLAPFLIFYDQTGNVVASSGYLHDRAPAPPDGVLDYARQHGGDRVTWQPEAGVRIAAVIVPFRGREAGCVLAGRLMREVEKREDLVMFQAGAALLACLGVSLVAVAFCEWFFGPDDKASAEC